MYKKKTVIAFSIAMMCLSTHAADNSIYIDQTGDNATVTMTQSGAGNVVRGVQGTGTSNTTPAAIYGNNNSVTVTQDGSGNTLSFGLKVGSGTSSNPNVINYSVTGNSATAVINANNAGTGAASGNNITITQ